VCEAPYQLQGAPTTVVAADEPVRSADATRTGSSDDGDASRRREILARAGPAAGLGLLGSGVGLLLWRRGAATLTQPSAEGPDVEHGDEGHGDRP